MVLLSFFKQDFTYSIKPKMGLFLSNFTVRKRHVPSA